MRRVVLSIIAILAITGVAEAQTTREVTVSERTVVRVNAKLRFTTMIILPEGEQILDFVCGDKDFWVVSGAENLAYVKPAKAGAQTNLNLVTSSGHVYSFLLMEGADDTDLKLYVVLDPSLVTRAPTQRYYTAAQVDDLRKQAEDARTDADLTRATALKSIDEAVSKFRTTYPTELQFPYLFKANENPFHVSAIFHDGRFTYIRAKAAELPSLYEMRDGAPNLVNFQVENGMYVVPKVLERGYLTVGKQRWAFEMGR